MSENQKNSLTLDPDRALFEGHLQGLIVTVYQNERPPSGLAGLLDWHFHGAISSCIRKGAILGKIGECIYFPLIKNGSTFHLILAGSGHASTPGTRAHPPAETLQNLQKNLLSLKLSKIGVSKSDFGNVNQEYFSKQLKGVPLWIVP
jgi:hypothetical protein